MFRLHSIALPVCTQLRPSVFCVWSLAGHILGISWGIPPLSCHIMGVGTNPHVPTCRSFGQLSARHCWPCAKAHPYSEVSTLRCSPLDLVSTASCILPWLICRRISHPPTKGFLRPAILTFFSPIRIFVRGRVVTSPMLSMSLYSNRRR
jgi:hypothetical protein